MKFISGVNKKPTIERPEDLVGYSNNYFWLLDGATPPLGKKNRQLTQEYICSLNASLCEFSRENYSTTELLRRSIEKVKGIFEEKYSLKDEEYLPYSTVVLVKFDNEIEYLVLGDSYLFIDNSTTPTVITDDRLENIAVEERKIVSDLKCSGIDEESLEYLTARKNLITKELEYQNKENGYWVAGLDAKAADYAVTGKIKCNQVPRIMATSDGLARLVTHLNYYSDFDSLAQSILKNGANSIFEKLRDLEEDETNFIKPIASKHDDASFFIISN